MTRTDLVLVAVLFALVAALAVSYIHMARRVVGVLERADAWLSAPQVRPPGLQPGSHVNRFHAIRQTGEPFSELDLAGTRSVVMFMKADCVVCRVLSLALSPGALASIGVDNTYVVVRDSNDRDALGLDEGLEILFQEDGTISWAFRSSATPQAFVVDEESIVLATGFPNSVEDLRALVASAHVDAALEYNAGPSRSKGA